VSENEKCVDLQRTLEAEDVESTFVVQLVAVAYASSSRDRPNDARRNCTKIANGDRCDTGLNLLWTQSTHVYCPRNVHLLFFE